MSYVNLQRKKLKQSERVGKFYKLNPELVELVENEAKRERIYAYEVLESIIEDYFREDSKRLRNLAIEELRLNVNKEFRKLNKDNIYLMQMMSLFVRVWLANTEECAETNSESTVDRGRRRFKGFVEQLSVELADGVNLFDSLTQEMLLKDSDFKIDLPMNDSKREN